MNKRFFTSHTILGLIALFLAIVLAVSTLYAAKQSQKDALTTISDYVEQTTKIDGIILDPALKIRVLERSKEELARRQDARGYVRSADVTFVKKEFRNFAKTLAIGTELVGYFVAIKGLKATTFTTYQQCIPKASHNTKQAVWRKIKKQIIDKNLRVKAFINKEGELVVKRKDLETLTVSVISRTRHLAMSPRSNQDRMISLGYAESKVRNLLRKSGYHNPEHVTSIMQEVKQDLKKITTGARIALSKLEDMTVATMKRFKRSNYDPRIMSRLAAEIKILKAVKQAGLSSAKEITVTNDMMDTLSRNQSRGHLTQDFVDGLIKEKLGKLKEKHEQIQKKIAVKKEQKRGTQDLRGRWGNLKYQERHGK